MLEPPGDALDAARVRGWSAHEVGKWLTSVGLPQYKSLFADNAITGEVLLEVGQDDLDYLSIRALGHRKRLLSGIDALKRAVEGRSDRQGGRSNGGTQTGGSSGAGREVRAQRSPGGKVHWTDATLAAQERAERLPRASPPVNLADGEYDEARERERFQQAVMEWRNGGSTKTSSGSGVQASGVASAGSGASGAASMNESGLRDAAGGGGWSNPFSNGGGSAGGGSVSAATSSGGALLDGDLDEEAEHAKFAAAVAEWRSGGRVKIVKKGQGSGSGGAEHKRLSCWLCYRLYAPSEAGSGFNVQKFCSKACEDKAEEQRARKEKIRAERRRLEQKEADAAEAATKPPVVDIWDAEIKY